MPEPVVPGDGYRVRISQVGGDNVRCSDSFYLMPWTDGVAGTGAAISVVSPTSESLALAGEEYTVEVSADDQVGCWARKGTDGSCGG